MKKENPLFSKSAGGSSIRLPDNLRSDDVVEIVLGLCEGEIEGLEKGYKSFYIGDTALQNENGTDNFSSYQLEIFPGSGVDEKIKFNLGGTARSTTVNVELSKDIPVVRQLSTDSTADYLELRFNVQALYIDVPDGVGYNSIDLKVEYKELSAKDWVNAFPGNIHISGKTTSIYVKEVRFPVPLLGENQAYEVRVTKLSNDNTEDFDGKNTYNTVSIIYWESIQEIDSKQIEHKNLAMTHLTINSGDQFSSVPQFSGVYKFKKIRVPSNYDPVTRTYEGVWDGSFKIAWSDNPAWCLYDLVMNDRYGMNAYAYVVLDKWDTYEAGRWCDEMVSDGRGGKQPRYTCNIYISDVRNGKEQLVYMAGLFNAVLVEEASGYLRLKVDKDDPAVMLFTPQNVTSEGFNYTFSDPETRYNDITVAFTNPELGWTTDRRRIYNQDEITKNGRVTYEYAAVGCIYEGEALRRTYYKLLTSITEKLTVTFNTNRVAQVLSNFDTILISDPTLGYALSGRILSIDENDRRIINLRDPIYLEAGIEYKVQFTVPEGVYENTVESLSGNGSLYQIILKEPLPDNIPDRSVFTISGSEKTGTPKPFRVLSVSEVAGNPDTYTVTAIEINRNKWDAADNFKFEYEDEYSGLPSATEIPYALDVNFSEHYDAKNIQIQLMVSMELDHNAYPWYSGEMVVYSREVGTRDWVQRPVVNTNLIIDHPSGKFEFVVLPKSILGNTPPFDGAPVYIYEVTNVKEPPSDVKDLTAEEGVNGVTLSWTPNPDIDLVGYEIREGIDWRDSKLIATKYTANMIFISITDSQIHHYMVKAIDGLGNYSINAATISSEVTPPGNVEKFYVTLNNDQVRFDWTQVEGVDMEYVIKKGDSWDTGIEVLRAKGNNASVVLPSYPGTYFSIKALSKAGLYSEKARYAKPDVNLDQNRNIIIEIDNGAEGFPGITYGFEPDPELPNIMAMTDTAVYAEHYFNVTLAKVIRARNWFETQAFNFGKKLNWLDLHYRYNQPEAHITWLNSSDIGGKGEIATIIAPKSTEPYDQLYGFSFNNTLDEMNGKITPSIAEGVSYNTGRLTYGLFVKDTTEINWNKDVLIPETFSLSIRIRVTEQTPNAFRILRLWNREKRDYMFLYVAERTLFLTASDGGSISLPIRWIENLDFLTVAVSQSDTERSLYYYSSYAGITASETIEIKEPLGNFTSIQIGEDDAKNKRNI